MRELICDTSSLQYLHQLGLMDVLADLAGFLLLIPPIRRVVRRRVTERLRIRVLHVGGRARDERDDNVVEGEVVEPDERDDDHGPARLP